MKKTTDFGACRDLYGRRLRHVNDEIRLKKWLEDKEREEEGRGACVRGPIRVGAWVPGFLRRLMMMLNICP